MNDTTTNSESWHVRACRAIEAYGRAVAIVAIACQGEGGGPIEAAIKRETAAYREWFQIISEKEV